MDLQVKPKKVDTRFPKWKYHKDGRSKLVKSEREEKFLGDGWAESPADHGFIKYEHSEEYLAMQAAGDEFDDDFDHESEREVEPVKARRGRPKKE